MTELSALDYLKLTKAQRSGYKFKKFIASIPGFFKKLGLGIYNLFKKLFVGLYNWIKNLVVTFIEGDWRTRISYVIMGFGSIARGQVFRGILFLALEVGFILYMVCFGGQYLAKLNSLGTVQPYTDPTTGQIVYGDNSFRILLFGILSLFFIVALIYTWNLNIKQNRINEEIARNNKTLATAKDDLRSLVDKNFNKSLLALPTLGIVIFTLLPIFFMILIAFTNYDATHNGVSNALFGWVGGDNFAQLFTWSSGGNNFAATFGEILLWTLIWAFFATFTNYFLGMVVAMLINKKGIKFKKLWRTILVLSIAIPQFISLLYVSKMFAADGIINQIITNCGGSVVHFIDEEANPMTARITVILINIWIGIPYLMLVTTGILMNIPADLYESASIDGANVWQQYSKITLPYMLFVTGPYLLTSFTGNMNNFNVIYLLTGGAPHPATMSNGGGQTDLLITWLFNLAISDSNYKLGAVLGIIVFVIVAVLSLVVYNLIPSTKNEEEFQ